MFPPRRTAKAVKDKLKSYLDKIEGEIVIKEDKPKSWVNNMLIREKPDGDVRLCLDPKYLNEATRRPYLEVAPIQEIIAGASKHAIYSVIDLKQGFWHCELDQESTQACAFSTPFGTYRFLRLPYGISSAPEIFMAEVKIFSGIPGVQMYYDDLYLARRMKPTKKHFGRLSNVPG